MIGAAQWIVSLSRFDIARAVMSSQVSMLLLEKGI